MSDFVHLHVHSEYSLLDGLATIELAIKRAAALGMPALAITDHGNMYGLVSFYDAVCAFNKEAKEKGLKPIKPILGTEFYVCDDLRVKSKNVSEFSDSDRRHLILLVKNEIGYKNLAKLNAIAFRDGYYYKPRIDLKTLEQHSEGLICLSACIAGDIPQAILHKNYEKAEQLINWFHNLFKDDFYLEIQNHGLKEEFEVNQYLRQASVKHGIKLVATNDVHYVDRSDALAHDVLLCVQTGRNYDDENRMKFNSDDYYIKSYDEMANLFPDDIQALKNTLEVAEKCNFGFEYGKYKFPRYVPDNGDEPIVYIRKLIDKGIEKKYGKETPEIRERIEEELHVIETQKFVEYFLIVWDYINAARNIGVSVGPGRGSGAGSIVAYLIGITDVDPLKYDLYFERFLNAERVSAPDFDVDFEDCRREEVIDYVKNKYGEDRIARIITFGTMAAKNAIKDVGRALGVPYAVCDKITKAMPSKVTHGGKEVEIKRPNILQKLFGCYEPSGKEKAAGLTAEHFTSTELVDMYNSDLEVKRMVDIAMRLEDTPRQSSTHACGVIIGHDVLDEHMPLSRNGEDITTQFTGVELEHLGFLKMDFLGLRNLSDIKNCIEYVKENYGVMVDFSNSNYDDPKVFELISAGNTDAIFQLESGGFKKFLKELKPTCLEDIIAAVSLYRPGPMDSIPRFVESKHHPEKIEFAHPLLKPILAQTYGCIVYQEQVMKIVQSLAGYTLGQADGVRRMMGKKKVEEMEKEEKIFLEGRPERVDEHGKVIKGIDGCLKRGVPEDVAKKIWGQMKDFAKYAFNKSHAAAYSIVTYQTAYLKAHYEAEFLTSFLNNRITKIEDVRQYTMYAKSEGIPVLPVDINESKTHFTVKDKKIRYGLGAIKNIGLGVVDSIIEEREQNGKFLSFEDFISRCVKFGLNKRMIENLILAGAFDSFSIHRSQLLSVYAELLDRVVSNEKNKNNAQISMFDTVLKDDDALKIEYPDIPEMNSKEKLLKEKEVCGIYLTGNPLSDYKDYFDAFNFSTKRLEQYEEIIDESDEDKVTKVYTDIKEGEYVKFGGIITEITRMTTKTGSVMAFANVEDLYGQIEVVVFPKVYEKIHSALVDEEIVKVSGRIQIKDGIPQIICDNVEKLVVGGQEEQKEVSSKVEKEYLGLIIRDENLDKIDAILDVCDSYPGDIEVIIAKEGKKFRASCAVRRCEGLVVELKNYLKDDEIVFFIKK